MGYLFQVLQPWALLVNVPVGTGMNSLMSIDDLEIGLWLCSDSSATNIIDLSHRRCYFNMMPGSSESITGSYIIFFHDQGVMTLLNQTLHTFLYGMEMCWSWKISMKMWSLTSHNKIMMLWRNCYQSLWLFQFCMLAFSLIIAIQSPQICSTSNHILIHFCLLICIWFASSSNKYEYLQN